LFVINAVFNTFLGEEFLFRGVLLPKMEGVFGRGSWVANGVLFGFYHVHQPWGIPNSALTGVLYTLHSAQSVFTAFLVLGVVLGCHSPRLGRSCGCALGLIGETSPGEHSEHHGEHHDRHRRDQRSHALGEVKKLGVIFCPLVMLKALWKSATMSTLRPEPL
jgi:membrane protease YdiL (CAAX protease family)